MRLSTDKQSLVKGLNEKFGNTVSRKQVMAYVSDNKLDKPRWLFNNKAFRAGRGTYDLSKVTGNLATTSQQVAA